MPHLPAAPSRRTTRVVLGAAALIVGGALLGAALTSTEDRTPSAARASTIPAEASCLDASASVTSVRGIHSEQFRHTGRDDSIGIDARGARWVDAGPWPVHVEAGSGLCWHGGDIRGGFPDDTSWEELHDTGAFNLFGAHATVEDLRVHNYGDGIRVLDEAGGFTILDVHLSFIRDDCIENDDVNGGTVRRALLDGCYVAFSARPWQEDFAGDGRHRTWSIVDSLVRLQPMPTVYRGDAPGHGGFFKWDHEGRAPRLQLHGNVFRADQMANHTTMGLPDDALAGCSDNVMVWLGEGSYPAPLPDCFRITTDRRVWDAAVARWRATHGEG